jgi:hypothetical protein
MIVEAPVHACAVHLQLELVHARLAVGGPRPAHTEGNRGRASVGCPATVSSQRAASARSGHALRPQWPRTPPLPCPCPAPAPAPAPPLPLPCPCSYLRHDAVQVAVLNQHLVQRGETEGEGRGMGGEGNLVSTWHRGGGRRGRANRTLAAPPAEGEHEGEGVAECARCTLLGLRSLNCTLHCSGLRSINSSSSTAPCTSCCSGWARPRTRRRSRAGSERWRAATAARRGMSPRPALARRRR